MGVRFIKIASVYFAIAVILGLVMGIIHNFAFSSVHAHINLLGWVSMALFGIIYCLFPNAGKTKLANTHFWLHNIGLPIMQGSLFLQILTGNGGLTIGIIIGSLIVVLGVLLFVFNLLNNVRSS
ncbi:cbb3-type cytochrome oxidase subunit 1 [Lysinibacillus composti]|uniref:Cytochrome-c oxidase n=1 Tax=Lysinibacillus composti TaxID=720633 RepID=A0A3N9UJ58_9BACI|nr:cytochrome-c oxidase [Lysinibacillus composti]MBM7607421.1 cbb3-type cytochrome oxidase subunit 1 [Lysinibacillus composti]RQW76024.1 cytochrome-c oxidase [Lysinibacillus composti]